MRALAGAPRVLTPLALAAAALGIVVPSATLAAHSDLLLALLVLASALGISWADLARVRDHARELLALSLIPLVILTGVAWLIGRQFGPVVRDGLLAVGLSSAEVAVVGLVALAGADAAVALGIVTGSLIVAALVGPLAVGPVSGSSAHVSSGELLARFALVVIVPLGVGVAARSRPAIAARMRVLDPEREGVAALTVAVLVYAAISGTQGAHDLGSALLASAAFLVVAGCLGELWRRSVAPRSSALPGGLSIAMRDFAVAAALATQAFGTSAAAVPGIYGVMMLVAGTIAAGRLSLSRAGR
jgi:predicted Na+-dependent transporter